VGSSLYLQCPFGLDLEQQMTSHAFDVKGMMSMAFKVSGKLCLYLYAINLAISLIHLILNSHFVLSYWQLARGGYHRAPPGKHPILCLWH